MLVALRDGQRVEAAFAARLSGYICPGCHEPVILKRGRQVCAHFAHKGATNCAGRRGETREHLSLKALITERLRRRGLQAHAEYALGSIPWERRADVMVWSPSTNTPIAIELQRSTLPIKELEWRALSYCSLNVAQLWIPFLKPEYRDLMEHHGSHNWKVSKYRPHQHELWISGQNAHGIYWLADPESQKFWQAQLSQHRLFTKEAIWYESGAIKRYQGPKSKISKRYRMLSLNGPYDFDDLKITIIDTSPIKSNYFQWPGGKIATFIVNGK